MSTYVYVQYLCVCVSPGLCGSSALLGWTRTASHSSELNTYGNSRPGGHQSEQLDLMVYIESQHADLEPAGTFQTVHLCYYSHPAHGPISSLTFSKIMHKAFGYMSEGAEGG